MSTFTHNVPLADHWTRVCFDVEYERLKGLHGGLRITYALQFARQFGAQNWCYFQLTTN